jgi:cellulose synthase operon protein C
MIPNGCQVKPLPHILLPVTLVASLFLLPGCGRPDPAKLIESAKVYILKGDSKSAIIELKAALQEEPESGEGRFLLGKALLAAGDAAGAQVELQKALQSGHTEDDVVPELARAMFARQQYGKLREEFGAATLSDAPALADLKVTLARTNAALGRIEEARKEAAAALSAIPGYGPATVFMARLQAGNGDIDGALALLDAEVAKRPNDYEALQTKADLLYFLKRNADGALSAYRQAIAANSNYGAAHAGAVTVLLGNDDLEAAKNQLAKMKEADALLRGRYRPAGTQVRSRTSDFPAIPETRPWRPARDATRRAGGV